MEAGTPIACHYNISVRIVNIMEWWALPVSNHFLKSNRLVNACVIHDKYRVSVRKGVHVVKEATNKTVESFGSIRMISNIQMKYAIKRQCWKNGVPLEAKMRLIKDR
jgi:hypothetical protein